MSSPFQFRLLSVAPVVESLVPFASGKRSRPFRPPPALDRTLASLFPPRFLPSLPFSRELWQGYFLKTSSVPSLPPPLQSLQQRAYFFLVTQLSCLFLSPKVPLVQILFWRLSPFILLSGSDESYSYRAVSFCFLQEIYPTTLPAPHDSEEETPHPPLLLSGPN